MATEFREIRATLAPHLDVLNEHIRQALDSPNELMNRIIGQYLEKPGKQIRPTLVFLSAQLVGGVGANVISGAVAVELLHNASLIHDDVVDDTTTRRGAPTINGQWDNHLAVLVGDFFLSNALLQAGCTEDLRIIRSISNLGRQLSVGELDEIFTASNNPLSEEAYFNIIYRKTASLFVSCAEIGAYAAGEAEGERLNALREFARLLGIAFQIKDDVFDYFSDEKMIGKPTGNDISEGKVTLPLLHVLGKTDVEGCEQMRALACRGSLQPHEVEALLQFAIDNGGIEYAFDTMQQLRRQAVEQLEVFPPSAEKDHFIALFDYIISRSH